MSLPLSEALRHSNASGIASALSDACICSEITTDTDFLALEPLWRELFAVCTNPTPFASWEWASAWWETMRGLLALRTQRPRLLALTVHAANGCVVGLAPFYFVAPENDPLAPRCLRLFGVSSGAESATEEPVILLCA